MADLGRKHTCFKCGAKFYDLKKPKALCPKCGADQAEAPVIAAPPPPPAPVKRGPRPVDPVEDEPPIEDEEAVADVDDELDMDAGEEDVPPLEEVDETGEDSYD